jgi:hypothetical protein
MWTKIKALLIASLIGLVILSIIAVVPFIAATIFIVFWAAIALGMFSLIVYAVFEWLRDR